MLSLAILAGGKSERMGEDKALMPFLGEPLILRVYRRLKPLADEVIVTGDRRAGLEALDLPLVADLLPGRGPLGGLYTALRAAGNPLVAVVGCDLPFASLSLFTHARDLLVATGADVVMPAGPAGLEPLHAVYRREACLPAVRAALQAGEWKLIGWLAKVRVRTLPPEETDSFDPDRLAFWNLNTPQDFVRAEARAREADAPG